MNVEEVLAAISGATPTSVRRELSRWATEVPAFAAFLIANSAKVQRKLRHARTRYDVRDVLAELEFVKRLARNSSFNITYEPYDKSVRNPDLLVQAAEIAAFNVDVKRIRESPAMLKYEAFEAAVFAACKGVPSSLGISLIARDVEAKPELADRLQAGLESIVAHLTARLLCLQRVLEPGESVDEPIPGFQGELDFHVFRLPGKALDTSTVWLGGIAPVLYTQKESLKFGDQICSALGQLRPGMPNVLGIRLDSSAHEPMEVDCALAELYHLAEAGDHAFFQQKGFRDARDYLGGLSRLTVIVVCGWDLVVTEARNHVWQNSNCEIHLPKSVLDFFAVM